MQRNLPAPTMASLQAIICVVFSLGLSRGADVKAGDLLSVATTGFSQRLYQKLVPDKPNAVYSPFSIHSALSMTSIGARGDTATELSRVLGLTTLPGNAAHQAYRDLIVQLNGAKSVKLNTANAIFVNPNIAIETQFVTDVQNYYLATAANIDLAAAGGPEKPINDFVSNKTEGLIKNIIPQGSVNDGTVTVLVNTVFFNGTWASKFSEFSTREQNFQKLGGAVSKVNMMNDEKYVNIKRGVNGVDVAELPFSGGRFSLYIALPQKVEGLGALESFLATPGNVDQLFQGLTSTHVRLSIPKFKIESSFGLNSPLIQLGLVKAFDPAAANFQGISRAASVQISDVLHKAVIEVKETGTVAAAATAVIVGITAVLEPPSQTFVADHPFVFFLRDKETSQILFQGKFSG